MKQLTIENGVIKVIYKVNQSACPSPEECPCEELESHKNRPKYHCVCCSIDKQTLSEIIKHCIERHGEKPLKYREFAFDPVLNKYGYKSKLHEGIIQSEIKLAGKDIHVSKPRL
ncbi:hypothetical protein DPMN_129919 [Dreissena polymorpha]|uniref:Uncharacterized protein n=1 Tax=Dreissena polymorpha TaxID=45954 RepID=A0A9D4K1E6_DREPO|nr:hypothetical protein DPMN_129919 [Dreissena polymorpha]